MKKGALWCYGLLGLPLAMAALPVYVQIPNYYTSQLGLPLAGTGLMLFFARLIDTIQDPFLGKIIDKIKPDSFYWLIGSGALLGAAFYGLWLPPVSQGLRDFNLLLWLGLMLIVAYTAHSMLNIAYLTWGAGLATSSKETTPNEAVSFPTSNGNPAPTLLGAAAWREGFGLIGVILASILPAWILQTPAELRHSYLWQYCVAFGVFLLCAIGLLHSASPKPARHPLQANVRFRHMFGNPTFGRLACVYFFNSLSVAIPATLLLFFINDQIRTPEKTALYLTAYFVAGACGLPLWIKFAKKYSTRRAWQVSMLLALSSFIGAAFLGAGDAIAFLSICIVSGLVLGADLALPPVLLAETVTDKSSLGSYYGIWSLIGKLSLALAGLSLPLLHLLGFQSASDNPSGQSQLSLIIVYALVPCFCKLIAFQLLRKLKS